MAEAVGLGLVHGVQGLRDPRSDVATLPLQSAKAVVDREVLGSDLDGALAHLDEVRVDATKFGMRLRTQQAGHDVLRLSDGG